MAFTRMGINDEERCYGCGSTQSNDLGRIQVLFLILVCLDYTANDPRDFLTASGLELVSIEGWSNYVHLT